MSGYAGPITEGQRWTFVNVDGSRTYYVLEGAENEESVRGPVARLLNPKTDKYAQVTVQWLREPKQKGRVYWVEGSHV